MCTAATYQTECFYMGRTLDYEFSYGEEITITPREFPFEFRHGGTLSNHYAIIGMAHAAGGYPLYYREREGSRHGGAELRGQREVRPAA